MKRFKLLSLIAVFTALFTGCEEPQEGDTPTFKCIKTLEGHLNYVESVAYSPDGTKIISGSSDNTVKIWDAE